MVPLVALMFFIHEFYFHRQGNVEFYGLEWGWNLGMSFLFDHDLKY